MSAPRRSVLTPALTETDVAAQITGFLSTRRWKCVRMQSGTFLSLDGKRHIHIGEKGMPDWIATRGIEVLHVEIKRPGKTPSRDQLTWLEFAAIRGTPAIWADSLESFQAKYSKVWTR